MLKRALLTALAWSGAAYANDEMSLPIGAAQQASSERVVYEASFFVQFTPRTARDMVARVPGFSIDGGDDRRGFSGAVGNVLIDGVRPAAKSQSIDSILERIPAAQVLRIELLRGAETAGDASGQSVLVNVVRTPTAGGGVWSLGAEVADRGRPSPQGELSWSGRRGTVDYGASATYFSFIRDLPGPRTIRDGQGQVIQRAFDHSPRDYYEYALSGNFAAPLFGGRLSTSAEAAGWYFDALPWSVFTSPDYSVITGFDDRDYQESEMRFEGGANYERAIGPWAMELIGLVTRRRYELDETLTRLDGERNPLTVTDVFNHRDSGETILRGAASRSFAGGHAFEFGAEGAFNSLDAALDFSVNRAPEDIENGNVLVEEERAEAFATYTWRPNARWALEARAAHETSTLTFSGDTNQSVELSFWKPSLQISRTIGERNQVRARVFRDVGQLDFDDFVSAVATTDDRIDGGNPDLVPYTLWRAEAGGDLRFGEGGAITLVVYHSRLEDAPDVVPVGPPDNRFDAPGNIGDATINGLELTAAVPLAPLIPGGRLSLEIELEDSQVTDPLTGKTRPLSNVEEAEWEIEFRQDLPAWKFVWGVEGYGFTPNVSYRLGEIDSEVECACFDVFAETTAIEGLRVRARVANVLYDGYRRERRLFDPDRNGELVRIDRRERDFGTRLTLTVSGEF